MLLLARRLRADGRSAGLLPVRRPCRLLLPTGVISAGLPYERGCKCDKPWSCKRWKFQRGSQPAIIDTETDDLWAHYLKHREQTKATAPRARKPTYALSGLIRHGDCRQGMAASQGRSRKTGPINGYAYKCSFYARTGGAGCKGGTIPRARVEREVLQWLAREAADGIDGAPSVPQQQRRDVATERARAARERARLTAELEKIQSGLSRLRADYAMNPDDYGPGEYEAARARIKQRQATAQAALDKVAEVEATPDRTDYEPLIVGLLAEWETIDVRERNGILRQLLRRVAVYRVGRPGLIRATSRIEIHPAWEPDPWDSVEESGAGE